MIVRHRFYWVSCIAIVATILFGALVTPTSYYLLIIIIPLVLLGLWDCRSTHNILRNYPVIGHIRYMFEFIRPEIQQYFVATNLSGRPFNREIRSLVVQRAKQVNDTHPFGTERDIDEEGYQYLRHSVAVKTVPKTVAHIQVGGIDCQQPYLASRLNISAMSFGALSKNAVMALNLGAKLGGFAQNTGEGGLTPYHLKHGGDIILQLGTAYFGYRTLEGQFDRQLFIEKSQLPAVKMIEIKISQGAKPSHGGLLPAAKITPEIAQIRHIKPYQDCLSPPQHSCFNTPIGLLEFIAELRELSGGKPVGFKLCIGNEHEFMGICKAMLKTGIKPDFITIDGAEGGTGAAPLEYTNRFGVPSNEAIAFAHNCLVGTGLRNDIRLIVSGKVATGFDMILKIALGADMCNSARAMMFAIGCIQALRCNTNTCPTGVTTQDPHRMKAIVVEHKAQHVRNFHHATINSFLDMLGAMGIDDIKDLTPDKIFRRGSDAQSVSYDQLFHFVAKDCLLRAETVPEHLRAAWDRASAEQF
ncbi:MAG: FMN-binding glutamate synthase family protein [Gammaproteobacteria bacterium]